MSSESMITSITKEEWRKIAYSDDPPDLKDDTRQLLETYSKIPADEVLDHVTKIRERGYAIFPFPCIGRWRFLNLAIGRHPLYKEVLSRMLTGKEIFLDLGCAFAQDVRRLVADGVDSSKCYGSDLRLQFLDLGYELFRDKETLKTTFIEADVFKTDTALTQLDGKVNIINASSFFHLFSWAEQKQVAHRCVKLFTGQQGDLILGRQVGEADAGETPTRDGRGLRYRHNIDSWKRLWLEVGQAAGIDFDVQAQFMEIPGFTPSTGLESSPEASAKMMIFSVRRIS